MEPVAPIAVGVGAHLVVEVTLVEPLPARDRVAILGPGRRPEAVLVLVLDVGQLEEHAVDEPEVVTVLQADDLLAATLRMDRAEARRPASWRH